MTTIEAMKQALDALLPHKSTVLRQYTKEDAAIDALSAAIAREEAQTAEAEPMIAPYISQAHFDRAFPEPALAPTGERAALIKRLRETDRDDDGNLGLMWEASDMLAADARELQILRAEVELYRTGCDKREARLTELKQQIAELQALSVTNILLDVVPGDGSGLEVYAKSVKDVEATLTKLGTALEDAQGELSSAKAAAQQATIPQDLTIEDALRIARGCTDYGGGYRGNAEQFEIYQHGIQTVINALTAAASNGLENTQIAALHSMGADAQQLGHLKAVLERLRSAIPEGFGIGRIINEALEGL